MTALQRCIRDLMGHGVTFCHEDNDKLMLHCKGDYLQQADLSAMRDYKYLLLHILPRHKTFTASDIDNALECYAERTAILWHGGTGYDLEQAKNMAIPSAYRFLQSL